MKNNARETAEKVASPYNIRIYGKNPYVHTAIVDAITEGIETHNQRLFNAIEKLSDAWFAYCQDDDAAVPQREIYNVLAVYDGDKTMEQIEAQWKKQ